MSISNDLRPRTVVLLQYTGIGDLVWHIPYFEAVARHSRDGKITLVAQPSTMARAILQDASWIADFIDHDHRPRRDTGRRGVHAGLLGMWRMARTLRAGRFDRIVLFSGRASRGLIAAMSGIPDRLGYGYRSLQRIFLNHPPYIKRHGGSSASMYPEATAFCLAHGFCERPVVPRISPAPDDLNTMRPRLAGLPRPLCAFAIGTSEPHKQWGAAHFAEVATALIENGASVLLVGGPREKELAERIIGLIAEPLHARILALTDAPVMASAAALALTDACLGNDTGMTFMAAAVGRPSYVLLGNRPPLDHDPLLHMIAASSLADISPQRVARLLQPVLQAVSPASAQA